MKFFLLFLSLLFSASTALADASSSEPDPVELLERHSHIFSYTAETLHGPGGDFLRNSTASSQFVLLGEEHMDHSIPIFAGALFHTLVKEHGFGTLVVEQDPVAIEDALSDELRGDVEALAAYSAKYPSLFEFDTDEDLGLLADVGGLISGRDAIWGAEQATSATRALQELVTLAPNADVKATTQNLMETVQEVENGANNSENWLILPGSPAQIDTLIHEFDAATGTRADRLLNGLAISAEIYGYYRRAVAGEFVGIYNNTVREALMKRLFLERYHTANSAGTLPKAMFKYGNYHLYHGKSPAQAYPIGNLAHELAIVNGMEAYGIAVYAFGENYKDYSEFPGWLLPLLPATPPTEPTLIDLRALRPYQRLFRLKVEDKDQWYLRDMINGYDAIVLLPGSRAGGRKLGGRNG
jgi:hypothetical protein